MEKKILVWGELRDSQVTTATLELVTKARELGGTSVVVLGKGAQAAVGLLQEYGARRVLFSEDQIFESYFALPHVEAAVRAVELEDPDLLLFPFSYNAREVAGRISARLGTGVVSNAVGVSLSGDSWRATVPYFGGSKIVVQEIKSKPSVVLIKPKSFEPVKSQGSAQAVELSVEFNDAHKAVEIVEEVKEQSERVKLEDAEIVVSGGRGLGNASNFVLLDQLAEVLGAAVGATRAVVDAGWVPYSMQIGQTGKTVKPNVYLAFGISGAMQHTVGMKGSKHIIAVNKDPDAPIFQIADLGIVGDALKILPKLTEAISEIKKQQI